MLESVLATLYSNSFNSYNNSTRYVLKFLFEMKE